VRLAVHEDIVGKARLTQRVRNDEGMVLRNRQVAERGPARGLAVLHAVGGLEPLPMAVDQRQRRHRHAKDLSAQPGQSVKGKLARRVEDVEFGQHIEALRLTIMRGVHRGTSGGGTLAESR
jgi:hypothetical protein